MNQLRNPLQHVAGVVPLLLLAAVLIMVGAGAAGRASRKLLWHDEIVTLAILQQPLSELWPMLQEGIDLTPPLFHLLTEVGLHIPLPEPLALRFVSVVMFVVCLAAVYAFVRYRADRWDALAAVTVIALSGAHTFAYEARAYAMLLAFTALAFVCWQRAASATTTSRGHVVSCVALALTLAAAVSSHYYALLLLIPLGTAELARLWARRRVDWGVAAALAAGMSPLLAYLPLIRAGMSNAASFFSPADWRVAVASYETFAGPLIIPCIAGLVAVMMVLLPSSHLAPASHVARSNPSMAPLHEWVATLLLVLLPGAALVLASLTGAGYVERYTIGWTIGLAFCAGLGAGRLARPVVIAAVVTLVVWLGLREVQGVANLIRPPINPQEVYAALRHATSGPIAVAHPHVFVQLWQHLSPEQAQRVVYMDRSPGSATAHADIATATIRALRAWYPLQMASVESLGAGGAFYFYTPRMYTVEMLLSLGAELRLLATDTGDTPYAPSRPGQLYLYEVRMPAAAADRSEPLR